jgi:non-ribosomal peptide synthetase component F
LSGQEDIVVGTVTAGRIHADLQDTVGLFVNTLALRNYPTGSKTFRKFLIDVHQRNLKAFENQDYQFEELVEQVVQQREVGRNPLFDAAFGMQDIQIPKLEIPGVTLTPAQSKDNISKFDITWYGIEAGDRLQFAVMYRTELFKPATIQRFIDYFREIVSIVTNHPDIRLEDIAISHDFFDQELAIPDQEESDFGFE